MPQYVFSLSQFTEKHNQVATVFAIDQITTKILEQKQKKRSLHHIPHTGIYSPQRKCRDVIYQDSADMKKW